MIKFCLQRPKIPQPSLLYPHLYSQGGTGVNDPSADMRMEVAPYGVQQPREDLEGQEHIPQGSDMGPVSQHNVMGMGSATGLEHTNAFGTEEGALGTVDRYNGTGRIDSMEGQSDFTVWRPY